MPKTPISSLLIFAVALMTLPTGRVFAQAPLNTASETYLRDVPARKPDLKASFAKQLTLVREAKLKAADFDRMASQNQQQQQQPKPSFSRKEKIFLALWVVVMAGLVAVLIKHGCKGENKCEDLVFDTFDP